MNINTDQRLFVISSDIFSGFRTRVSLYEISTIEDIIHIVKNNLFNVLKENNLTNLIEEYNKKNFHIHSYTIEDILISKSEDIFYICDHCQNEIFENN